MSVALKMVSYVAPIHSRAMLVRLAVSKWTARKHDKSISAEVAHSHNAATDAGRYNKVLIAKAALEVINRAESVARTFHYTNTLPWGDDGYRILPAANYLTYTNQLRELRADFDGAVADFIASYASYVEEARVRLNGMFNADDYPTVEKIAQKFGFEFGVIPLPNGNDFRIDIDAKELAKVQAETDRSVNLAIKDAMDDLWKRVHDSVSHMATSLREYDVDPVTGKKSHPFRDSLVGNLRELVELLPRLNVTDDADLAALTKTLNIKLCDAEPDDLRANDSLRATVAKSAEDILDAMQGYFG